MFPEKSERRTVVGAAVIAGSLGVRQLRVNRFGDDCVEPARTLDSPYQTR